MTSDGQMGKVLLLLEPLKLLDVGGSEGEVMEEAGLAIPYFVI